MNYAVLAKSAVNASRVSGGNTKAMEICLGVLGVFVGICLLYDFLNWIYPNFLKKMLFSIICYKRFIFKEKLPILRNISYGLCQLCFVLSVFLLWYSYWIVFKETTLPNMTFLNFFWEIPYFFVNPLNLLKALVTFFKNPYSCLTVGLAFIFWYIYQKFDAISKITPQNSSTSDQRRD